MVDRHCGACGTCSDVLSMQAPAPRCRRESDVSVSLYGPESKQTLQTSGKQVESEAARTVTAQRSTDSR